jgi:hypothetical protein
VPDGIERRATPRLTAVQGGGSLCDKCSRLPLIKSKNSARVTEFPGSWGRAALSWQSQQGHDAVVKLGWMIVILQLEHDCRKDPLCIHFISISEPTLAPARALPFDLRSYSVPISIAPSSITAPTWTSLLLIATPLLSP